VKLLGWIPARGGSRGVPGKNKRLLGGRPLIAHTIVAARDSGCLERIQVSSDDPEIMQLACAAGADAPWQRPAELATDCSPVIESLLYDLDRLEREQHYQPDAVMLLQPTSPFRSCATIRAAVSMFASAGGESVISVSPAREHPYWCKRILKDGTLFPFLAEADEATRRQDLPPAHCLNGVVYVASRDTIISKRSFYSEHSQALVIAGEQEALDIDTPYDWQVAEALWNSTVGARP
jgi:CMP-N-acetylneuraminic acid synthetase